MTRDVIGNDEDDMTGSMESARMAGTRLKRERYKIVRAEEKRIQHIKKRQCESVIPEAQSSMKRNDMRRFYATVKDARLNTSSVPAHVMFERVNELTDKTVVDARSKIHVLLVIED